MFIIEKEFHFEAAHHLGGLPDTHPCSNVHGHSYKAIFILKKTVLNDVGFVVDYRDMDLIKAWIDNKLDHKDLNVVFDFNPTAENIAKHLYDTFAPTFPDLASVTVKETEKTAATYEPFLIEHRKAPYTR
jgi:6-pyruvoyltetrahydropterin/6-carboxytetrahydropterin synthase